MTYHIIITFTSINDVEAQDSAAALFFKLNSRFSGGAEGGVIWYHIEDRSEDFVLKEMGKKINGVIDFNDANVYAVSHGVGGRFGKLAPESFAFLLDLFLKEVLKIPVNTKLGKLYLLACNISKPKIDGQIDPSYLIGVDASIKNYRFEKIMCWYSWVTIFTFKHLTDLCKLIISDLNTNCSIGNGFSIAPASSNPAWRTRMAPHVLTLIKQIPPERLLNLVGRRLIEIKYPSATTGSITSARNFESSTFGGRSLMVPQTSTIPSSKKLPAEESIRRNMPEQLLIQNAIVDLIAEYAKMVYTWTYIPQKSRLCLTTPDLDRELTGR